MACGKGFPRGLHPPVQLFIIRGAEQIFAGQADTQRVLRHQRKLEVLLRMHRFNQRRVRTAIREYQAIHAKLPIVGLIAKITAVGPANAAIVEGFGNGLIGPVPHKSSLQPGIITKRLPVIGIVTEAVAHGMRVFAQDQGPLLAGQADPFFDPPFRHRRNKQIAFDTGIHWAEDVGGGAVGAAAFILHRA